LVLITIEAIKAKDAYRDFSKTIQDYSDASGKSLSALEEKTYGLQGAFLKLLKSTPVGTILKFTGVTKKLREEQIRLIEKTKKLREEQAEYGKKVYEAMKKTDAYKTASNALGKVLEFLKGKKEEVAKVTEKKLIPATKKASEETKTLAEKLGIILKIDLEKKLKLYEEALVKYKGKLTTKEEQDLIDKIKELKADLGKTADGFKLASDGMNFHFAPALKYAYQWAGQFATEAERMEWQIREFAGQMKVSAADVYNACISMFNSFGMLSGIALPKISTESGRVTTEVKSQWVEVSERIRDKWTTELGAMLAGTTSFKDAIAAVWTEMKQQFFDLVAQKITGMMFDAFSSIIEGAKEAGTSIVSELGKAAKSLGSTVAGIAKGAASALSTLGQVANIVTAIASVIGLFKKADYSSITYWLKFIKDNTQIMINYTKDFFLPHVKDIWNNLFTIKDRLASLCEINRTIMTSIWDHGMAMCKKFDMLINAVNRLGKGRKKDGKLSPVPGGRDIDLGAISAQHGGQWRVQEDIQPFVAHRGEMVKVTPPSDSGRGGGDFNLTLAPVFHVSAIDDQSLRNFFRGKGGDEIISWLETNIPIRRIKAVLGI